MTLDLPTFGYPMNPTEIAFLSLRRRAICRSRLMSAPLPNAFVRPERNARIGNSELSRRIHARVTRGGTRSTLFSSRMRCLSR